MFVYYSKGVQDVKLNVARIVPKFLRVYYIDTFTD